MKYYIYSLMYPQIIKEPHKYQGGKVKLYAASKSVPDPDIMDDMTKVVLDAYYKI